jgi:hypothetical protein
MNKNVIISIIVLIVLVAAGIGLWAGSRPAGNNQPGTIVMAFTDATANINNVSEVDMTVNQIETHSQADGWVTLSANPKTYHLLALNKSGRLAVFDKVHAEAGIYDQVRVTLGDVVVKMNNGSSMKAALPSKVLTINDTLRVMANQTSALTFDVKAKESLHVASNNQFVFAPVVVYKSLSNANINVNSDDTVNIGGGEIASSGTVGMDVTGETKADFMLEATTSLTVNSGIVSLVASSSAESAATSTVSPITKPPCTGPYDCPPPPPPNNY